MIIIFHLFARGTLRFSELEKAIPAVSQKMLIQQLRELERDGVVTRTVYPQVPPKVEYDLTDWGKAMCPALDALLEWAALRPRRSEPGVCGRLRARRTRTHRGCWCGGARPDRGQARLRSPRWMPGMQVKVVVHEAEEGGFWAEVRALPGCVSQGDTMDELLANVREAIEAWLATEPPIAAGAEVKERHTVVALSL